MNPSNVAFTRRRFIQLGTLAVAAATVPSASAMESNTFEVVGPPFLLPSLPYPTDSLEPVIDARTMEIHHGKHHAAYVAGLNSAIKNQADLENTPLGSLLATLPNIQDPAIRTAVRNHGGGHWNHSFFWELMTAPAKAATQKPSDLLSRAIQTAFGSMDGFQKSFADAATKRFGSGWAWLVLDPTTGKLKVTSTANQDNPLMKGTIPDEDLGVPLLGIDVWEHAYYLHYQNRRADYISAWWKTVNWDWVSARHNLAVS